MPGPLARLALAALLLGVQGAAAQSVATPAQAPQKPHQAQRPEQPKADAKSAAKPPRKAAAPVVKPKPGPARTPPATAAAPAPPPEPEKAAEPTKGSNTGLALPRFAALRFDDVNLRAGPGTRYPIKWVYKRRDLPVEIQREFEVWRLIRDQDGTRGWVHQAALIGRRTAVTTAAESVLRREPNDTAAPVARLKPGVIIRLRACEAGSPWCQASVQDYRGWIRRADFWGTLPGEAIQ